MKLNEIAPWLIPLLIVLLGAGGQMYGLIQRVDAIEVRNHTTGEAAIERLAEVEREILIIKERCKCTN